MNQLYQGDNLTILKTSVASVFLFQELRPRGFSQIGIYQKRFFALKIAAVILSICRKVFFIYVGNFYQTAMKIAIVTGFRVIKKHSIDVNISAPSKRYLRVWDRIGILIKEVAPKIYHFLVHIPKIIPTVSRIVF